jgi:hypothetical protein
MLGSVVGVVSADNTRKHSVALPPWRSGRCDLAKNAVNNHTQHNPFAAVYVTCLDRDQTDVTKASRLLVLAAARCRNKGQRYLGGSAQVLMDKGTAPIIVEPVAAEIGIKRAGTPTLHVLDHDGRRTGRTVPAKDGRIVLDGAENKTIYYEIEYR